MTLFNTLIEQSVPADFYRQIAKLDIEPEIGE
jgi:hypothetical protein